MLSNNNTIIFLLVNRRWLCLHAAMAEVPGAAFSSFEELLHVGAAVPENIIIVNANSTIQYEFSSKIVIVMIMEYF